MARDVLRRKNGATASPLRPSAVFSDWPACRFERRRQAWAKARPRLAFTHGRPLWAEHLQPLMQKMRQGKILSIFCFMVSAVKGLTI